MRIVKTVGLWIVLATAASAQQVMDGSDKNVPADLWNPARDAVLENLRDPYSTQFDHLKVTSSGPSKICGRFNAKNQAGGYDGFKPFLFDDETKDLSVNEANECGAATGTKIGRDLTPQEYRKMQSGFPGDPKFGKVQATDLDDGVLICGVADSKNDFDQYMGQSVFAGTLSGSGVDAADFVVFDKGTNPTSEKANKLLCGQHGINF